MNLCSALLDPTVKFNGLYRVTQPTNHVHMRVCECVFRCVHVSDHSRYLCLSSSSVRSTTSGGGTQPDWAEIDVHGGGALCFQEEIDWITPPRGNLEMTL